MRAGRAGCAASAPRVTRSWSCWMAPLSGTMCGAWSSSTMVPPIVARTRETMASRVATTRAWLRKPLKRVAPSRRFLRAMPRKTNSHRRRPPAVATSSLPLWPAHGASSSRQLKRSEDRPKDLGCARQVQAPSLPIRHGPMPQQSWRSRCRSHPWSAAARRRKPTKSSAARRRPRPRRRLRRHPKSCHSTCALRMWSHSTTTSSSKSPLALVR
mmetsp:Transcript_53354/g.152987  ORF Transcript_53354/g.152987 Transcript_53354/m.152987 type:complete len:213 (-) Transcript_53354:1050-1688(-)